jgi:hypothetical protein
MSNIFNQGGLNLPPNPFDSKQRAYKRRAYGSVKVVGNKQFTCSGGGASLTFGGDSSTKFAQGGALQPRSGGRYVPNPYLTSITTKNQGSGGIEDTALWEIEFQYICYGTDQLNKMANAFMIPGMLVDVTIGYSPGDKLTISKASVYDFSFSYNSDDGSYSCTCKCMGENSDATIAGALKVKPSKNGVESVDAGDKKNKGYSIIKKLQNECDKALGLARDEKGNLKNTNVPSRDGTAVSKGDYGLIKGQKDASTFDMIVSLGSADNILVPVVKISRVVGFLNELVGNRYKLDAKYKTLAKLKSADPMAFCLPGKRGKYGEKNDFSKLTGADGSVGDIWVSIPKLIDMEDSVMQSQKEDNKEYTTNQLLNKIFAELSTCTGTAVDCFISEDKGTFYILNRKNDIKKSGATTINLLSPSSPIKSLSMSSNMDPDMAAIAFAGSSGPYPKSIVESVFAGCKPKEETTQDEPKDPGTLLDEKIKEIGQNYSAELAQDCKGILKQYVNKDLKGISMRYGIDLSVTLDGWNGPKFMQKFTVNPLPNAVSHGSVYFAVGEIEHKCDGETWDTTIVGYMMVNA